VLARWDLAERLGPDGGRNPGSDRHGRTRHDPAERRLQQVSIRLLPLILCASRPFTSSASISGDQRRPVTRLRLASPTSRLLLLGSTASCSGTTRSPNFPAGSCAPKTFFSTSLTRRFLKEPHWIGAYWARRSNRSVEVQATCMYNFSFPTVEFLSFSLDLTRVSHFVGLMCIPSNSFCWQLIVWSYCFLFGLVSR
jgi:hypothetical protein